MPIPRPGPGRSDIVTVLEADTLLELAEGRGYVGPWAAVPAKYWLGVVLVLDRRGSVVL